jgi:hypothetical protein
MLIVKETFIARPGHAGELAKLMKKSMAEFEGGNVKVLLDQVTDYNTIVIEYEVESLAHFEKMMANERSKNTVGQQPAGPKYTDLYLTGKREIFRVVE